MFATLQKLYNFYFRYPWSAGDFSNWQTGMVGLARGQMEGLTGAAVLSGLDVTLTTGMGVSIAAGIASGSDGYNHVLTATYAGIVPAPTTNPVRNLVVLRKLLVSGDTIADPTNPSSTVPLTSQQSTQVVVVAGTESTSPTFNTGNLQQGDCVLFGYRAIVGQSTLALSDLDFNIRDIPGKNSNFQQVQGRYDDRLRCYASSTNVLGVKPSQSGKSTARVFTYINKLTPSLYPRTSGGAYNGDAVGDSFYNFQTGVVSGGDQVTGSFSGQTTMSAGQCMVATVSITSSDVVSVTYGIQGTRLQCYNAIINQTTTGNGSITLPVSNKLLCFALLTCNVNSQINEVQVFDARGPTGTPSLGNPMTTLGDMLYENSTPTPTRLAGNTQAFRKILTQTGDGTNSAAPGWNLLAVADLPQYQSGVIGGAFLTGDGAIGRINGNPVSPSYVGEVIQTVQSTAIVMSTSGSTYSLCSMTLTAGVWLISGCIDVIALSSLSNLVVAVSKTAATLPSVGVGNQLQGYPNANGEIRLDNGPGGTSCIALSVSIPAVALNISASGTYYLVVKPIFAGASVSGTGYIQALRVN